MSPDASSSPPVARLVADLQRPFRWGAHGVTSPERAFALPVGTVTFLLTDVEGSTRLWSNEPSELVHQAMARHHALLTEAVDANGGVRPQEQGEGDSIVAAFARPSDALRAALQAQRALVREDWPTSTPIRVRMAVHTGEASLRDESNYAGQSIIRCARLRALGHGGQVLVSGATRDLAVDQVADEFDLRSLGEHRLRDLGRSETVWQLVHPDLSDEFPALASLDEVPNNLPVVVAPFIGRLREVETLANLVRSERLVTAAGSGGAGKTRLAQQVGALVLDDFPAGVWWVELAPLRNDDVASAVQAAFGLSESMQVALAEGVRRLLDSRRSLLIVDNCEHVVDAVTAVLEPLLRAAPTLHVLATSRVTLDLPGELSWRVPPLTLPDRDAVHTVEALSQFDAVRVFSDRARRARPNFRLDDTNGAAVAELCHRLGGIPLALELAAARCRMLSPTQILTGLDDSMRLLTGGSRALMPRQQTLEASIAWSVDLLSDSERRVLARLSVFRGGCTLDAAEAVCSDETLGTYEVFDALDRLVDHSLVTVTDNTLGTRFAMLETVAQFGSRLLADLGDDHATRQRHRDWFTGLIERWYECTYAERVELAAAVLADEANAEAAFADLVASGDLDRAGQLLLPLMDLVESPASNRRRCDVLLAHPAIAGTRAEVYALSGKNWADLNGGRAAHALGEARAAVDCAERIGDDLLTDAMRARLLYLQGGSGGPVEIDEILAIAERLHAAGDRVHGPVAFVLARMLAGIFAVERYDEIAERCAEATGPYEALVARGAAAVIAASHAFRLRDEPIGPDTLASLATLRLSPAMRANFAALHALSEATRGLTPTVDRDQLRAWADVEGSVSAQRSLAVLETLDLLAEDQPATASRASAVRALAEGAGPLSRPALWVCLSLSGLGEEPPEPDTSDQGDPADVLRLARAMWSINEGELTRASHLLGQVWDRVVGRGQGFHLRTLLEVAARLHAAGGQHLSAAHLLGACEALREAGGFVRFPLWQRSWLAACEGVCDALGAETATAAMGAGAEMSLDAALGYARRSNASPAASRTGWQSLTPTEAQVVAEVAEGLTNAAVAARLLMSPETVKTHLSRSYTKLGIANRAELRLAVARRKGT